MKSLFIAIFSIITLTANAGTTAVSSPVKGWDVYTANHALVVNNNLQQPLEVTITDKAGKEISKTKVDGREKLIPIKDLGQGKYQIKIKAADKEQQLKLLVL